jgi:3',5'-cyclic AMP phosphodiesterase CpdA
MSSVRVIVVSDSHLSNRTPEASANWDAVVDHVAAERPDLVVHAGDISVDGHDRVEDLEFARAQLARLHAPLVAVPGNHDIGDNPPAALAGHDAVTLESVARFRRVFGSDRFSVRAGQWRLVGIDAQLLDAGSDDEVEQWQWLERELSPSGARHPVALVLHKPLVPAPADPDRPGRYVTAVARRRLLDLLDRAGARLVVSGHVHQALRHDLSGAAHVWAPSTWAVLPDDIQPVVGDKTPGVVELTLHDDGRADVEVRVPAGMGRYVLGIDAVDPYDPALFPPSSM